MYVLTTDSIPIDVTIKIVYSMIETTYPVEISEKGIIRSFMERKRNEREEAYDSFVSAVRTTYPQANFVLGTKVSTSVGSLLRTVNCRPSDLFG